VDTHGERGAPAYNGGRGAEPPAGVRGRPTDPLPPPTPTPVKLVGFVSISGATSSKKLGGHVHLVATPLSLARRYSVTLYRVAIARRYRVASVSPNRHTLLIAAVRDVDAGRRRIFSYLLIASANDVLDVQ